MTTKYDEEMTSACIDGEWRLVNKLAYELGFFAAVETPNLRPRGHVTTAEAAAILCMSSSWTARLLNAAGVAPHGKDRQRGEYAYYPKKAVLRLRSEREKTALFKAAESRANARVARRRLSVKYV